MFVDVHVFSLHYFVIISVWKKALAQHLNKFEFSLFKDAKFDSTWPSGSGEDDSKILSVKFPNFYIISL